MDVVYVISNIYRYLSNFLTILRNTCYFTIVGIIICIVVFLINNMSEQLLTGNVAIATILVVLIMALILNLTAIGRQPVQKIQLSFKVKICINFTHRVITISVSLKDVNIDVTYSYNS